MWITFWLLLCKLHGKSNIQPCISLFGLYKKDVKFCFHETPLWDAALRNEAYITMKYHIYIQLESVILEHSIRNYLCLLVMIQHRNRKRHVQTFLSLLCREVFHYRNWLLTLITGILEVETSPTIEWTFGSFINF